MATPFQITLIPDAKPVTLKPGWHKRTLAAERRHKVTTAPQRGNPAADAKAVQYAEWLAARDGTTIPAGTVACVDWQPCAHGMRPCAVEWRPAPQGYRPAARGMAQPVTAPLLRVELPHWAYEAPPVVETTLREWSAPVVTELPAADGEALRAILDPCEPAGVAEPCEAAPLAAEPVTVDHIEPMALCPAVGLPCKVSCGFRAGCGRPVPLDVAEAVDPVEAIEAEPLAPLCSDDDVSTVPGPVTVLCLSHKAREAVLSRTGGRAVPDYGATAKAGAFRLSLDDAAACAGIRSARFIGLPRKPYTRVAAPASHPVVEIPHPAQSAPFLAALPRSVCRSPAACYAAPTI